MNYILGTDFMQQQPYATGFWPCLAASCRGVGVSVFVSGPTGTDFCSGLRIRNLCRISRNVAASPVFFSSDSWVEAAARSILVVIGPFGCSPSMAYSNNKRNYNASFTDGDIVDLRKALSICFDPPRTLI